MLRGLSATVFCGTDIHGNPINGTIGPDGMLHCPNIAGVPYDPANPPQLPVVSAVVAGNIPPSTYFPYGGGPTGAPFTAANSPYPPSSWVTPPPPSPVNIPATANTSTTLFPSVGVSDSVPQPSGASYVQSSVAAAVASQLPPSTPGSLPSGSSSNYGGGCLTQTYRFILATGGGFATGANRAGCTQTNSAMCDPQFFNTLAAAIQYALSNGEIPYQVLSAAEPWALIACTQGVDSSRVYNADGSQGGGGLLGGLSPITLGLIGVAAWLLLR